jgi:uncharacterized protein (DUF427 family)
MVQAVWKNTVLADSDDCIVVEGNYYFPPDTIRREYLRLNNTHTDCSWKGRASNYDIVAAGEINRDAAWFYPSPMDKANNIRGYIAFWKGVEIKNK